MKVSFYDLPVVRANPAKGCKCFELVAPFSFSVNNDMIEVPVGFWTDFASTGPAASIISPIDPFVIRPAVGHDFLYFVGYKGSQAVCDEFIAEGMRVEGSPSWKRMVVWAGVTIGGGFTWHRYRRDNKRWAQQSELVGIRGGDPHFLLTVANWDRTVSEQV
jgi:hypothetical protein